jgi:hypothetical protein
MQQIRNEELRGLASLVAIFQRPDPPFIREDANSKVERSIVSLHGGKVASNNYKCCL